MNRAFVLMKEYSARNKRQLFSLLMSGQGESHSEKVDICAYSSKSSRMGSSSLHKACHDYQGAQ